MAEDVPPAPPTPSAAINWFIDGGLLARAIEQAEYHPNAMMSFVSHTVETGVVRILIGGTCCLCGSAHMRNICNAKYNKECISPILTRVFPIIQSVVIVRSDDLDLAAIVRARGGRVSTPFSSLTSMSFAELNKMCLDQHPEVDGYVKTLSMINRDIDFDHGDNSREAFTDMYTLCWCVMEATSVVSTTTGEVLTGPNEILSNTNALPQGFTIGQEPDRMTMMLVTTGRNNFSRDRYKVLWFG